MAEMGNSQKKRFQVDAVSGLLTFSAFRICLIVSDFEIRDSDLAVALCHRSREFTWNQLQ
jgi:hypothetical protein